MAKVPLTIELDEETAFRLRIAARTAGEAPDAFATRVLVDAVEAAYWAPAQASLAEYERTGVSYSVEEVFADLRARLAAKQPQGG
ncbi:MAG: hypothetical protein HY859_17775 [Caulobacterales bacterium]|nr:hypothetical protein [Caulobacterales bacterium]